MKRFVLVYNPISGHAFVKTQLDYMIDAFERRDAMLIPYRTRLADTKMAEFIREADPVGVLAMGGDGTLNEVVTTVLKNELHVPIAVIGSGTSNDFATHLGVTENLEEYFDHIVAENTTPSDVGMVNGNYFVNVASAGMFTAVAHEVNARLKHAMGKAAYYLRGIGELPKFHTMKLHVVADGAEHDLAAYFFIIVNSTIAGGVKNAAPLAKIDDGKLDLVAVKQCSMKDFVTLAAEVIGGRVKPDDPNIFYVQASSFEMTTEEPEESDLDGERGPMLPLHIETLHHAIDLFV